MSADQPLLIGRVRKYHSNYYYVDLPHQKHALLECFLKGMLKKEGVTVLVGDRVELDSYDAANQTARIIRVLDRENELARPKIANVDLVVIVHPAKQPDFDANAVDRYLTSAHLANITPILCISKIDLLDTPDALNHWRDFYRELGYTVIMTSTRQPETLVDLTAELTGKTSVLAGPSGVGKSSLLNVLKPELDLRTKEVSEKIARGQHTTRHVELLLLAEETYVADTPGFSNVKFDTVMPTAVRDVFPEFQQKPLNCEFSDCLHLETDTGCQVNHEGLLSPSRVKSYRDIITESQAHEEETQNTSQKAEYGYKTVSSKGENQRQILKLKGKDRQASRRTERQKTDLTAALEEQDDHDSEDDQ